MLRYLFTIETTMFDASCNEITLVNDAITALRCQVITITSLSDKKYKTNITNLKSCFIFY
jgi:phage FluMu gp28-like protein